jgi:4-amino-4-deoxychorismate lyase
VKNYLPRGIVTGSSRSTSSIMAELRLFTTILFDPRLRDLPNQGFVNVGWNQKPSAWYMLDYHRDRMLRAATHWDWKPAIETLSGDGGLKRLDQFLQTAANQAGQAPHRVKILLGRDGKLEYECGPVSSFDLRNLFPGLLPIPGTGVGANGNGANKTPLKEPELQVLLDNQQTAHTEFTHYKTTTRFMYDDARSRSQISPSDQKEVLIINEADGSVMEASLTTPYFWRNGRWVTPPVSSAFRKGEGSGGNDGTTRRWALERYVQYCPQYSPNRKLMFQGASLWKKSFLPVVSRTARSAGSATDSAALDLAK